MTAPYDSGPRAGGPPPPDAPRPGELLPAHLTTPDGQPAQEGLWLITIAQKTHGLDSERMAQDARIEAEREKGTIVKLIADNKGKFSEDPLYDPIADTQRDFIGTLRTASSFPGVDFATSQSMETAIGTYQLLRGAYRDFPQVHAMSEPDKRQLSLLFAGAAIARQKGKQAGDMYISEKYVVEGDGSPHKQTPDKNTAQRIETAAHNRAIDYQIDALIKAEAESLAKTATRYPDPNRAQQIAEVINKLPGLSMDPEYRRNLEQYQSGLKVIIDSPGFRKLAGAVQAEAGAATQAPAEITGASPKVTEVTFAQLEELLNAKIVELQRRLDEARQAKEAVSNVATLAELLPPGQQPDAQILRDALALDPAENSSASSFLHESMAIVASNPDALGKLLQHVYGLSDQELAGIAVSIEAISSSVKNFTANKGKSIEARVKASSISYIREDLQTITASIGEEKLRRGRQQEIKITTPDEVQAVKQRAQAALKP